MKLFLLRHGIAEAAHLGMRDWERRLTEDGRTQLLQIGRALQRLNIKPNVLLTSPLVRAYQTAEIVAPMLECTPQTADELQPGCTLAHLQPLLRQHSTESVMIVGHQPDLSSIAARLINADEHSLVLKKAGLIRINIEGRPQAGHGRLVGLLTPKMLLLMADQAASTLERIR